MSVSGFVASFSCKHLPKSCSLISNAFEADTPFAENLHGEPDFGVGCRGNEATNPKTLMVKPTVFI